MSVPRPAPTAARVRAFLGNRRHLVETAAGVLAAGAAVVAQRWMARRALRFPEPGPIAAESAVSVHNAAKAGVIAAIRESDGPVVADLEDPVAAAVREGRAAGVDLTAVALGAVEGAVEVAHLLGTSRHDAADAAARMATAVADEVGPTAHHPVRELLAPYVR